MKLKKIHLLLIILLVGVATVLILQNTTSFKKEVTPPEAIQVQAELGLQEVVVSDLEVAGLLASTLAQYSPSLSDSDKGAISNGYFGAPLNSSPKIHTVTVKNLLCKQDILSDNFKTNCAVQYDKEGTIQMAGKDALDVYKTLQQAGIVEELSVDMEKGLNTISAELIACTVDDQKIQSSGGNNIQGFSCTIKTALNVTQASEKIKRFQQCVFTMDGKETYVSPCTVNPTSAGLVTVGVSENSEPSANPFFYFNSGENEFESSASWNGGEINRLRADVPLPGTWYYQEQCIVGGNWKLCFPESIAQVF